MITVIRKIKYPLLAVAVLFCFLMFSDSAKAQVSSFIDIGFRVNQGTQASPSIERVAIENPGGSVSSPLRLAKNGIVYRVALVDPSDPLALNVRIRLPGNITKALRKFVSIVLDFQDQSRGVVCKEQTSTNCYAEFTINNNTSYRLDFKKTGYQRVHEEGLPLASFSIPPNSNLTLTAGSISHAMAVVTSYDGEGWATYNISINGEVVDTVKYTWGFDFN